jgi:ribosomal protein L20A (L18A)
MTTKKDIEQLLKNAKYSKRYEGYKELVSCIELIIEDENRLCALVKVYEEIGAKYDVSWNSVEKNLRKVNETAWKRGGKEFINEISGCQYLVVPRTGELLEIFFDYLMEA